MFDCGCLALRLCGRPPGSRARICVHTQAILGECDGMAQACRNARGHVPEDVRNVMVKALSQTPCLNGCILPASVVRVLNTLESAGLEAWVVGGWVRDALRGTSGHDVDICCSGTWQENEHVLAEAGIAVVESGIKFGGITAVVDGERIEVTTYRLDGFYSDGRHPESVRFTRDVTEDLARRDFTVNAMAWHPVRGLLDLYGGEEDLERGVIRAVGEPQRRFEEDALRMLRAVRFACRLNFSIEPATAQALAACAPLLDAVARERVGVELMGILATGRAGDALMRSPEVMCAAIPELAACRGFDQHSPYHAYDVYEHTAHVLAAASASSYAHDEAGQAGQPAQEAPSPTLMWAALLHDVGKPATFTQDAQGRGHFYGHPEVSATMARSIMKRLAISSDIAQPACLLIRWHDHPMRDTRADLLEGMHRFAGEALGARRLTDELFDLKRADTLGKDPSCFSYVDEIEAMRAHTHALFDEGAAYSTKTLALTGRDLIAAGVEPGPRVGELLDRALKGCMDGTVANSTDDLLAYLGLA